jgi:DNA end-binding protein Ku
MPRPIWKGAISFGLVTIPVNLYSAIERRETLSFNLLHKKDGSSLDFVDTRVGHVVRAS